jgi:excisionase family DNA binding protein
LKISENVVLETIILWFIWFSGVTMKSEVYLTVQDVARLCDVHPQAVYYWINEKRIGCYKFGGRYRIPLPEFEAFKGRSKRSATTICAKGSER